MNIEISCTNYWKELNYRDALLYCSMVEIDGHNDWRLPTEAEADLDELYDKMSEYANHMSSVWTMEDLNTYPDLHHNVYWCIPVRTIV